MLCLANVSSNSFVLSGVYLKPNEPKKTTEYRKTQKIKPRKIYRYLNMGTEPTVMQLNLASHYKQLPSLAAS